MPPLPQLNNIGISSKTQEKKILVNGSSSFLVIILNCGIVHFRLLGTLESGTIDLSQHVSNPDKMVVYDVRLNANFDGIFILLHDGPQLKVLHFHNTILCNYLSPLIHLAQICVGVSETKT